VQLGLSHKKKYEVWKLQNEGLKGKFTAYEKEKQLED
jgi:hypothetical protein